MAFAVREMSFHGAYTAAKRALLECDGLQRIFAGSLHKLDFIRTKLVHNQLNYIDHFYSHTWAELSDPNVNFKLHIFLGV